MKLSGHTMGTPEYSLEEAIDLFARIGLDGIEIIVQSDGYPCAVPLAATDREAAVIARRVRENGLRVAGLTPYLDLFNDLNESVRADECRKLKRVVDLAQIMGAGFVRVYGGKFVHGETDEGGRKLGQFVRSMRECGDYCAPRGVRLCLENHFGTMTTTAARTMEIVKAIDHENVGVLYDQANLAFFPAEEYPEAIALQKEKIFFVHCKDLVYRGGSPRPPVFKNVSHIDESERTVYSRIPGRGILDWPGILGALSAAGYDGWVSLEYERRWQKLDLPDAREGMPQGAAYIRGVLSSLRAAGGNA